MVGHQALVVRPRSVVVCVVMPLVGITTIPAKRSSLRVLRAVERMLHRHHREDGADGSGSGSGSGVHYVTRESLALVALNDMETY